MTVAANGWGLGGSACNGRGGINLRAGERRLGAECRPGVGACSVGAGLTDGMGRRDLTCLERDRAG